MTSSLTQTLKSATGDSRINSRLMKSHELKQKGIYVLQKVMEPNYQICTLSNVNSFFNKAKGLHGVVSPFPTNVNSFFNKAKGLHGVVSPFPTNVNSLFCNAKGLHEGISLFPNPHEVRGEQRLNDDTKLFDFILKVKKQVLLDNASADKRAALHNNAILGERFKVTRSYKFDEK